MHAGVCFIKGKFTVEKELASNTFGNLTPQLSLGPRPNPIPVFIILEAINICPKCKVWKDLKKKNPPLHTHWKFWFTMLDAFYQSAVVFFMAYGVGCMLPHFLCGDDSIGCHCKYQSTPS